LLNKVALISGGNSGLGRAVAIAFAKEGADIAIVYLDDQESTARTRQMVEEEGRTCLSLFGDVANETFCQQAVQQTIDRFGKLDVLVNNATEQPPQESRENISTQELESPLDTNICAMFYMTNAALPYLKEGSTIINTTSVSAYTGNEQSLDYSSTKGAIMTFTRSLSQSLEDKGIRVNGVAPGPLWTLLVPSNLPSAEVHDFGNQLSRGDTGNPEEIVPSFVFLASDESSYMAGQVVFTRSLPV
jgi:NAD(P)-dependent dehydrogenase (short-subunit alcohol dehydrogenase family)